MRLALRQLQRPLSPSTKSPRIHEDHQGAVSTEGRAIRRPSMQLLQTASHELACEYFRHLPPVRRASKPCVQTRDPKPHVRKEWRWTIEGRCHRGRESIRSRLR
jgi:hypothetical protein